MSGLKITLPVDLPVYNPPLRCGPQQCDTCPIHQRFCGGWRTCCGGGWSNGQERCTGGCDKCLGMKLTTDRRAGHVSTWNVCGKPQAVGRSFGRAFGLPDSPPTPAYTRPRLSDDELPAYVLSLSRMPRGPMREMVRQPGLVAIQAGDVAKRRNSPECWQRYGDRFLLLCSEQDVLQDKHETWYSSYSRLARQRAWIDLATGIEFSCYAEHGNLSHYRSVCRSLHSANAAQADLVPLHPATRLRLDKVCVEWLRAVPNIFWPFPGFTGPDARAFFRLSKWVELAYPKQKWDAVRLLLGHYSFDKLKLIPPRIRRSCSWLDQSTFATASGGSRGVEGEPRHVTFQRIADKRREAVTKLLRET